VFAAETGMERARFNLADASDRRDGANLLVI
jgi:hypothetical protein